MKNLIILLLRLALGIAFLSAVADRLGFWGNPESALTAWGNWDNFLGYTSTLTFGASGILLQILAVLATVLEAVLGILLILGYKTKQSALLSGFLLLTFGLCMTLSTHFKYAIDYSVFTAAFAAFLLSVQGKIKWSLDNV